MATSKMNIYYVFFTGKNVARGMQPVKSTTKVDARAKFVKRYPKHKVLSIDKAENPTAMFTRQAI